MAISRMESSTLGCACLGILVLSSRTLNMDCVLISLLALLILALVGLEIEAAQETRTEDPAPDDAPDRDAGPGHGTPIAPATYGGFHQMPAQPIIISRMTVQSGTALRETYSSKDLSGPVLTESVMLALAGGGLGILLGMGALSIFKSLLPSSTPGLAQTSIDWPVAAAVAGLALITGLAFGIAPALSASQIDLAQSIRTGSQRSTAAIRTRLRGGLIGE